MRQVGTVGQVGQDGQDGQGGLNGRLEGSESSDGGAWAGVVAAPIPGRLAKPRLAGLTMVIDKGMGLDQTRDWLSLAAPFVDLLKFGFGTSFLYSREALMAKIKLCRDYGVEPYVGGTFGEIAWLQGRFAHYLDQARRLGLQVVEISDGTIALSLADRRRAIESAREKGFRVIAEVGKKALDEQLPMDEIWVQVNQDLELGAGWVIVEGRESGLGIGIYGRTGQIREEVLPFLQAIRSERRIIWEAPLKPQQEELIRLMGPNVSLGNISPAEVIALECLRQGLRSDTLREVALGLETGIS